MWHALWSRMTDYEHWSDRTAPEPASSGERSRTRLATALRAAQPAPRVLTGDHGPASLRWRPSPCARRGSLERTPVRQRRRALWPRAARTSPFDVQAVLPYTGQKAGLLRHVRGEAMHHTFVTTQATFLGAALPRAGAGLAGLRTDCGSDDLARWLTRAPAAPGAIGRRAATAQPSVAWVIRSAPRAGDPPPVRARPSHEDYEWRALATALSVAQAPHRLLVTIPPEGSLRAALRRQRDRRR